MGLCSQPFDTSEYMELAAISVDGLSTIHRRRVERMLRTMARFLYLLVTSSPISGTFSKAQLILRLERLNSVNAMAACFAHS